MVQKVPKPAGPGRAVSYPTPLPTDLEAGHSPAFKTTQLTTKTA